MTVASAQDYGFFRLIGATWTFVFSPQTLESIGVNVNAKNSKEDIALTLGRSSTEDQVAQLSRRDNESILGICTERIVSRAHAKIFWKAPYWYITCLSKNAIRMGPASIPLGKEVKIDTSVPIDIHIGNQSIFLLFPTDKVSGRS